MTQNKELKVNAIKDGTVIDRIPAKNLFKVISILKLDKVKKPITFGTNLESHVLNTKAIIKITDHFFADEDINKIALVAPQAKLNIIEDYKVVLKKNVEAPNHIVGIAKCMNPYCITNHEKVVTHFEVISKKEINLKCCYCDKITNQDNLEII